MYTACSSYVIHELWNADACNQNVLLWAVWTWTLHFLFVRKHSSEWIVGASYIRDNFTIAPFCIKQNKSRCPRKRKYYFQAHPENKHKFMGTVQLTWNHLGLPVRSTFDRVRRYNKHAHEHSQNDAHKYNSPICDCLTSNIHCDLIIIPKYPTYQRKGNRKHQSLQYSRGIHERHSSSLFMLTVNKTQPLRLLTRGCDRSFRRLLHTVDRVSLHHAWYEKFWNTEYR